MDKFEEMMQKEQKMSEVERTQMMAKNKAMCICGRCPTNNDCMKGKGEVFFCTTGKSLCTMTKRACICPTCPIMPMLGFKHGYYCANGSERELRNISHR